MNAAGHPTRYKPEYGELAHADARVVRGLYDRAVGDHHTLEHTAPGNTTCGVLLFSRPLIPVRKNYLTQRAATTNVSATSCSSPPQRLHRREMGERLGEGGL